MIDTIALWVGYAVLGSGAAALAAFLVGVCISYFWKRMLRDVPSWYYVQNAVAVYREQYPPGRWAKEQMPWRQQSDEEDKA